MGQKQDHHICDKCGHLCSDKHKLYMHVYNSHREKVWHYLLINIEIFASSENIKRSWQEMVDQPVLKFSWTPKAHHIADHFSEYFEDPLEKGQALGVNSDQIIEHMSRSV